MKTGSLSSAQSVMAKQKGGKSNCFKRAAVSFTLELFLCQPYQILPSQSSRITNASPGLAALHWFTQHLSHSVCIRE